MKATRYLLERPDFSDWAATVIFYTALHIVEALFFREAARLNRKHGHSHEEREQMLKGTGRYKNIYRHYRPLQSASVKARYLDGATFASHMSAKQVQDELIKGHLWKVIQTASRFLSDSSGKVLQKAFKQTFS